MRLRIQKSRAWGSVPAPPSKSMAHRLLLGAALAEGTSELSGMAWSEDILATLDCIRALGARCTLPDGQELEAATAPKASRILVTGTGGRLATHCTLPCRESGSTLRFFLPLPLCVGGKACLTGTERLMARGIGIYEELFRERGISLSRTPTSVEVSGRLEPGDFTLRGDVSSQFATGLLFALSLLPGESRLHLLPPVESRPYLDMTVQVLARLGVQVREHPANTFTVPGGAPLHAIQARVEGDWSNAAALLALNELGGDVRVEGLRADSPQGDRVCLSYLARLREPGATLELSSCPDLAPVLFAVAAAKHGAVFTGTRRLRIKESDRAAAMAEELAKLGARVLVEENSVTVTPPEGGLHPPTAELSAHNDHRIVMALALLLTRTGGCIPGAEAVRKSYPDFADALRALHVEVYDEA